MFATMDMSATQILDDIDIVPTQTIKQNVQVGILHIGPHKYPIKSGINKIGRHPDCNIVLIDRTVSKHHAEIEATYQESSVWIRDLNSSNKTKLNNSLLRPGPLYELKNGSVLEFGAVLATYTICQTMNYMISETPASNSSVQISTSIDEKAVQDKPKTRQKTRQKPVGHCQLKSRGITDQVGQESQEVEMITMMNSLLQDQNVHVETTNPKTINESTRTRNTRKQANSNTRSDIDTENSASSELSESKITQFQASTSRAKLAKISEDASKLTDVSIDQSSTVPKKGRKPPSKSTHSQQLPIDSFLQRNVENSINKKSEDTTLNKTNKSKAKGKQSKAKELEFEKKRHSNVTEESITSGIDDPAMTSPLKVKHKVLFTGVQANNYNTLLKKLGASQVDDPAKCTVLVTDKVRRTVKFLCAIAQSVPIVSLDWLNQCKEAGHFVDLKAHILKDPAAEMKFGFRLGSSLEKAKQHKLLQGFTIVVTPNVSAPPIPELKSIVASCGGKCLVRAPPSWPEKSLIISSKDDLANAKKFATKAPKTVTVQSTEFLLTGILRQELDFIKYKLI